MKGPLDGVKVLDLSTTFSGPYATLHLSDLGASVLKIEAPTGDVTRGLGQSREPDMASVFVETNRGKKCIALDLKDPADHQLLRELIAEADILLHNMRPAAADKLGVSAAVALELNPQLIHVMITGFGSEGPYGGRPAYDDSIQALSGLAWLQGLNAAEPTYVATALVDKLAGIHAALAAVSALHARNQTGVGQSIEVPMFETMAAFNLLEQWGGRAFVPPTGPTGYQRLRSVYRRPYRTKDGVLSVVVYHAGHWQRFLREIGREELLEQEKFNTTAARNHNIDELYALLAETLLLKTSDEWVEILERIEVPVTRVLSLDELIDDPHLQAVDFFQEAGAEGDRYLMSRSAMLFSGTPLPRVEELGAPGRLGADLRVAIDEWRAV